MKMQSAAAVRVIEWRKPQLSSARAEVIVFSAFSFADG